MSLGRQFRTLWRRELKSHLRSMFGWILIAGSAAFVGGLLLLGIWKSDGQVQTLPILFANAIVVLLPPLTGLATMRSFAEERQRGTLEGLLSSPVPDRTLVFAKFAGAYTVAVLSLAAAVGGLVLYAETADIHPDYSRTGIAAVSAMFLFHSAAFTAFGILISILSRSPAIAAAVTCFLATPAALLLSGGLVNTSLPDWFDQLSITQIASGSLDSRPVVFALSALFLFLFASVRALEARRWKF